MQRTSDINVVETRALPSPAALLAELPKSAAQADFVTQARREIHRLIFTDDKRFLLIVGPCSIHDLEAGRDYARRLSALAKEVSDRVMVVMRVYFEKPRTTVGWKGLVMDPHLDGSHDIAAGLRMARTFLRDVLDLGLPTATELLDPITPQYSAGLICWSAIGARTAESQTHRQMASGLSMPLGFKNGTDGSIATAINAIKAAAQPHTFLGINLDGSASAIVTRGNAAYGLIHRHRRAAKRETIVGQLRHDFRLYTVAFENRSSIEIADRLIRAAAASISSRLTTGSRVSTSASVTIPTMPGSSGNSHGLPLAARCTSILR